MKNMFKNNLKFGALLSSVAFALSALSACSDYAGDYEDSWDSLYGDDAKVDGETAHYSIDCENVLWYAFDGENFMNQTVLGTSWESFTKGSSDILFTGLDKNRIRFNANFLNADLTSYIRYKGGISGELLVPEGASDFLAGVRFGLEGIDLSDKLEYEGLCLAYSSAYNEVMLSLMELGDKGNIQSEYRSEPLGASDDVKTVKVPLASFQHKSGEKSFSKFLNKANSLGVIFTSTKRNSEGFVIVGVGTYGGSSKGSSSKKTEASSSSSAKATSNSSKTSSSSAKATSNSSKTSSSSTKATSSSAKAKSSSSKFYWNGYFEDHQLHTGFEGDDAGWWFHYTDSSVNGKSYFQWPASLEENDGLSFVIDTCKGVCGAVHVWPGFDAPFAGLGFAVSSKAVDVSKWEGLCVEYASDVPIKVRLEVADPEDYDYDIPIKILDASSVKTTMNIPWENFGSSKAGTGAEVAAKLKTVSFYFDDLAVKDGFFDIIAVGEYDACYATSAGDNSNVKKLQNKINDNMDLFVDSTHVTGIPTEDILWYGANMVKNNLPTTNSSIVKYSWVDDNTSKYVKFRSENVPKSINADSFTNVCRGGFCGTITSVPESGVNEYPAMGLEFNDTIGVADFGGICVTYSASTDALYLSLQSPSEEDREYFDSISWNLFQVQLDASDSVDTKCFKWENFKVNDEKNRPKMFTYLQHVHNVKIGFDAVNAKGTEFNIVAIGRYTAAWSDGVTYLNRKMNIPSAWDFLNPEVTYDTIVDKRDKQQYVTVKIGDQEWMAENLNYDDGKSACGSVYYAKFPEYSQCYIYGRNYSWENAKDACPDGWHLPSGEEWKTLLRAAKSYDSDSYLYTGSWNLESGLFPWSQSEESGNMTNLTGFSAIPSTLGSDSYFWTSSEIDESNVYDISLNQNNTAHVSQAEKINSLLGSPNTKYVRCVSDETIVERTSADFLNQSKLSEYVEFKDARDSRIYKAIKIGEQLWMAENLKYVDSTNTSNLKGRTSCGEDEFGYNCDLMGALYTWYAAVDNPLLPDYTDGSTRDLGDKYRGICPEGWHLPSKGEFEVLAAVVGEKGGDYMSTGAGWCQNIGSLSNSSGFSALPYKMNGDCNSYFWTSTDFDGNSTVVDFDVGSLNSLNGGEHANTSSAGASNKLYIRCVSDETFVTSVYNETEQTLLDARDGQTYKTTTIGDQVWMAENLNYDDDNVSAVCYNGEDSMCETYGRLYSWDDAQNVCPSGWHLPSEVEFNELLTTVGSENATKLMAVSGWYDNDGKNNATEPVAGYDSYGFCALPAGTYGGGSYKFEKIITYMWSTDVSTEDDFAEGKFESNNARCLWFAGNGIVDMPKYYKTNVRNLSKNYKSSVRCLKD